MASGSPVRSRKRSCPPSPASSSTRSSVRVSCQTIALCTGVPVRRSHSTVVSRWLVMPMAARSRGADAGPLHGLVDAGPHVAPDLDRVVLDPAGAREDLPVLALVDGHDAALGVEDDAARGGGALVDRRDEGHLDSLGAGRRSCHGADCKWAGRNRGYADASSEPPAQHA